MNRKSNICSSIPSRFSKSENLQRLFFFTNVNITNNFSSWNVRDCDPLIEVLETWKPHLVPWILDNLLDQLVMPRLIEEVAKWDPLTDTVPIHTWIHPWIPLTGTYGSFIIV